MAGWYPVNLPVNLSLLRFSVGDLEVGASWGAVKVRVYKHNIQQKKEASCFGWAVLNLGKRRIREWRNNVF